MRLSAIALLVASSFAASSVLGCGSDSPATPASSAASGGSAGSSGAGNAGAAGATSTGGTSGASNGGSGGTAGSAASSVVGVDGGTVTSADGLVALVVPKGALSGDVVLAIDRVGDGALTPVYEIAPSGTRFLRPVVLSFAYAGDTAGVAVANVVASGNIRLASSGYDATTQRVFAETTHLSQYTLVPAPACKTTQDCEPPFQCVGGVGCAIPCRKDAECPSPFACLQGLCGVKACTLADDCAPLATVQHWGGYDCSPITHTCIQLSEPAMLAEGAICADPPAGVEPNGLGCAVNEDVFCYSCVPKSCTWEDADGGEHPHCLAPSLDCAYGNCYPASTGCSCLDADCPCGQGAGGSGGTTGAGGGGGTTTTGGAGGAATGGAAGSTSGQGGSGGASCACDVDPVCDPGCACDPQCTGTGGSGGTAGASSGGSAGSSGAPPCSAQTCPTGCCASDGSCQPGTSQAACGYGGQACEACPVMGSPPYDYQEVCGGQQCCAPQGARTDSIFCCSHKTYFDTSIQDVRCDTCDATSCGAGCCAMADGVCYPQSLCP